MSLKIEKNEKINLKFNFEKYITLILSLVPRENLVGLSRIRILDNVEIGDDFKARYIPTPNGKQCEIEINLSSLNKENIPKYLFNKYPEIAGLLLSEYIFHEIGHHIHSFKKHGVKKQNQETFANEYAKKGYYAYIDRRKRKILISYFLASIDIFLFNKQERKMFADSRSEIITWYNKLDKRKPHKADLDL